MDNNSGNLRRSTRLKTQVNNQNEKTLPCTPVKKPPGFARRGKPKKSGNNNHNSTITPKKNASVGKVMKIHQCDGDDVVNKIEQELDDIDEEIQKPLELFNDEDISGNRIYGFQTPSKKNAMVQKALLSRTPQTSKSVSTPKTKTLRVVLENCTLSPTTPTSSMRKFTKNSETRKRNVHFSSESESVSEGSEYMPSNTDESDNESESNDQSDIENNRNINQTRKTNDRAVKMQKNLIPITPCRRGRSKNNIAYRDYHLKTDEYFESQSEKSLTSDHTLGRLKNSRLDEKKLQELLSNENHVSNTHKNSLKTLTKNYKSMFPLWDQILEEGYSLLLYGLGSKKHLIADFHRTMISDYPTVIINGFFPSLTIKDILSDIITELLALDCPTNLNECFNIIEDMLKKSPDDRLYFLIHNIDGVMLHSNKAQDILSRLAAIPNTRVIASVDHINAPLLWDSIKKSRYNFYWCDTTTLLPYQAETSYESSLLVQHSGALALSSLRNVFASLTTNAKAIYTILVKYQLENSKNNLYSGMPFKDLYRSAREGFLVSSDIALRAQLTEFIDHKLVRTKRNIDGAEYLIIPLDNTLLQNFLDDQETTTL